MPALQQGMIQDIAGCVRIKTHLKFPTHAPAPTPILP